jgi:CBS domain-containing protein
VTCALDDTVGEVREQVEGSPYGFALVLAPGGTLLGRLRKAVLEGDPGARAGDVMEAGPTTVRPDLARAPFLERLEQRNLTFAIVSTPEGKVIGIVRRSALRASI